ncbi:MAG TPA: CvpA family protein [Pyrinomonadaceae bacterium]|jgi:membrane protein required for colicin V production
MTVFDFIVILLVGASVVAGALRGFVRALLTGVALICGLLIAARGYAAAGAVLRGMGLVEGEAAANAGGFILIMAGVLAGGFLAGRLVAGGLRHARLEWFDRALGAGFGLFRGLAVCSVLYLALTAFPVRIGPVAEAQTASLLAAGAKLLAAFTSPELRARFFQEQADSGSGR